jgi:hypothetical protein
LYQLFTGEERRIPYIFDDFHFCRSRVIGLDMTETISNVLVMEIGWSNLLSVSILSLRIIRLNKPSSKSHKTFGQQAPKKKKES